MQTDVLSGRRAVKILFILLFVAFFLRASGVFWGIPPFDAGNFHPDEPKIINGAYGFPGYVLSNTDLRYPTGFHHALGFLTWPLKAALEPHGKFFVYMTGRMLSVLMGTAAILLLYILAKRQYGIRHALLAAAFLSFSMLHVANSAWATTDVATSFWLLLFLLMLVHAVDNQAINYSVAAGAALGILVGFKYTGALAVIPMALIYFLNQLSAHDAAASSAQRGVALLRDRRLWATCITALLFFLMTTPGIVLNWHAFVDSMSFEFSRMDQEKLPLYDTRVWLKAKDVSVDSLGWPLLSVSLVGFVIACFSRRVFDIGIALMVVATFAYFGGAIEGRYLILIMPILSIFSAHACTWLLSRPYQWARLAGMVVCSLVLLYSLLLSVGAAVSRYPDTRTLATSYIRESVPPGSSIGIAYQQLEFMHEWRHPVIDPTIHKVVDYLEEPDYVVVSSYDAEKIRETLASGVLGKDYVLPSSLSYQWYRRTPPAPETFAFFDNLSSGAASNYELVRLFRPKYDFASIEFPAPILEIYKRKQK